MKTSRLMAACAVISLIIVSACGGGGGGGGTPPPSNPALAIVPPLSVPDGMIGEPYSLQLTSRGGTGAIGWHLNLAPSWMSIDSTGKLSGTPSDPGIYGVSVHAQDSATNPRSADYYIEFFISSPMQMTGTPENAIRLFGYSWSGQIAGGKPPFIASVNSGTLPTGVTMTVQDRLLKLEGSADNAGTYPFTVRIQDSASPRQTLDQSFTLKVLSILKITSADLRSGVVGRAYSDTVQSVNGTSPLTWAITSAGSGFTINGSGTVTGTPSSAGWRSLQVKVTDSSSPPQSDEKWLPLTIYEILKVESPITSITIHVNDYVGEAIPISGGLPPVSAVVASGTIPPGLNFGDNLIYGTPTTAGTWNFGLRFSDSAAPPQTYDHPVLITVLPSQPQILTIPPTPLVGEPYSFQMNAAKGTPPYKWDISYGALPGGLSLSQSGLLSGTAVAGGYYPFTFRVTDSATPAQSSESYTTLTLLPKPAGRNDTPATATVVPTSMTASLSPYDDPPGTAAPDTDYYKLYATAGSEVTVDVSTNVYPPDPVLEIVDSNGVRYTTCKDPADDAPLAPIVRDATPAAFDDECLNDDIDIGVIRNSRLVFKVPGDTGKLTTFYAHVLELDGLARPDLTYFMNASGAVRPLLIFTNPNVEMIKGKFFQFPLGTTGGSAPVTWAVLSGSLPAGITLSSSGSLSGTPTAAGNSTFTVTAVDSSNPPIVATRTFGVTVTDPLAITTTSFPGGQTGVPYTAQLAWSGGKAPFNIDWTGLPPGLSAVPRTGLITGTPTVSGSYTVSLSVSDVLGQYASKSLAIVVAPGPLYVATTSLPNATKNAVYSVFLKGAGGKQPYTWQLTSGALPAGITLNSSTGEVRGIATASGVSSFTVRLTDANAATSTATLQLTVQ